VDLREQKSEISRTQVYKGPQQRPPPLVDMGFEDSPTMLEAGKSKEVEIATAKLAEAEVDTTYETKILRSNAFVRCAAGMAASARVTMGPCLSRGRRP
jgi:hypothetical protein